MYLNVTISGEGTFKVFFPALLLVELLHSSHAVSRGLERVSILLEQRPKMKAAFIFPSDSLYLFLQHKANVGFRKLCRLNAVRQGMSS